MSDVGISNALAAMLAITSISYFLIGFIPGFYLSFLFLINIKTTKIRKFLLLLLSFLIGVYFGRVSFDTLFSSITPYFVVLISPLVVILELFIAITHFKKFNEQNNQKLK